MTAEPGASLSSWTRRGELNTATKLPQRSRMIKVRYHLHPFTSIYIHLHPFANSRVESQGLNLLSTWMYLVIEAVTGPAFEPAAFTVVFALDVGTLTLFKQQNGD